MSKPAPVIELRIEELSLRGFKTADRFRVAEALQNELTRLLSGPAIALPKRSVSVDRLTSKAVRLTAGATSSVIGAALGRSIYNQIAPTLGVQKNPRSRRRP